MSEIIQNEIMIEGKKYYSTPIRYTDYIHDRKVKNLFVEIDENKKQFLIFQYFDRDEIGNDCMKVLL